jgi:hypothetical protein
VEHKGASLRGRTFLLFKRDCRSMSACNLRGMSHNCVNNFIWLFFWKRSICVETVGVLTEMVGEAFLRGFMHEATKYTF